MKQAALLLVPLILAAACSKEKEAHASVAPSPANPAVPAVNGSPVEKRTPVAPPVAPKVATTPTPTPAPAAKPALETPAPAPAPDAASADLALMVSVRRAIDVQANLRDLDVAVSGGDVTLSGSVATVEDKDAAGAAAKSVPGVRTVDNQLTVFKG